VTHPAMPSYRCIVFWKFQVTVCGKTHKHIPCTWLVEKLDFSDKTGTLTGPFRHFLSCVTPFRQRVLCGFDTTGSMVDRVRVLWGCLKRDTSELNKNKDKNTFFKPSRAPGSWIHIPYQKASSPPPAQ